MQELLDEPLFQPLEDFVVPPVAKGVGMLLVVFWAVWAYLGMDFPYYIRVYRIIVDIVLLLMVGLLFSYTYPNYVLQQQATKYRKLVFFSFAGISLGYIEVPEIVFLIQGIGRMSVVYLLTLFFLYIYQAQPKTARIWTWIKEASRSWYLLSIFIFTMDFIGYYAILPYAYFIYFFFLLLRTLYFYKTLFLPQEKSYDPLPTFCFLASVHLIILGATLDLLSFRMGALLSLLGVGLALLTALYSWIKHIETPT